MKKYKALFFDWDGTAVENRQEDPTRIVFLMKPLLEKGIKLIIISGTNYNNIAGGKIHQLFSKQCLNNLYLGLDRGALNYGFVDGNPTILMNNTPSIEQKQKIDEASFLFHQYMYQKYKFSTDIVFSRINYCKIDLQVSLNRSNKLFLQEGEVEKVEKLLKDCNYEGQLSDLLKLSEDFGKKLNINLKATTDAKYLELGMTTKSDNVDFFIKEIIMKSNIALEDCAFFGDEFTFIADKVKGSDAYMITKLTSNCHFYDVSNFPTILPKNVVGLKGSTKTFEKILKEQI